MPRKTPLSRLFQPVRLWLDRIIIPRNRNHNGIPAFLDLLPLRPLIPIPNHNLPPPTSWHLLKPNHLGVQPDYPRREVRASERTEVVMGLTERGEWLAMVRGGGEPGKGVLLEGQKFGEDVSD